MIMYAVCFQAKPSAAEFLAPYDFITHVFFIIIDLLVLAINETDGRSPKFTSLFLPVIARLGLGRSKTLQMVSSW